MCSSPPAELCIASTNTGPALPLDCLTVERRRGADQSWGSQQTTFAASGTQGRHSFSAECSFPPLLLSEFLCLLKQPSAKWVSLVECGKLVLARRLPLWSNAYTDILTIGSSWKSPGEGSTGPGISGQRTQANAHNLGCSQEAPSQGKAVPNSTEGSYFSSYCRKLSLQTFKAHTHPRSLTPYY